MHRLSLLVVPLMAIVGAGCAVKRASYVLVKGNAGGVLVPPGVANADLSHRSFSTDIAAGRNPCPPGGDALRATTRGKRLRITVSRNALAAQPQGWLWNWTADAESQGCIKAGEGLRLVSRIVESLPLDTDVAYRLLRPQSRLSSVEIGPESQLQVVTPIMRNSDSSNGPVVETTGISGSDAAINVEVKGTPNLLGYETAWYRVVSKTDDTGFTFLPLSAERTIQGNTEAVGAPIANYLRFPSRANFYRLYLKADVDGKANTQMLITAPTRSELDQRTNSIEADPSLCAGPDSLCVVIPRRAAINVWMAVWVNGAELRIRGGTVESAVRAAGEKEAERLLPRLTVKRPYRGKLASVEFDRASREILDMPLIGGEKISW